MGAGLVQVAVPEKILSFVLSLCPELIGFSVKKGSRNKLMAEALKADAIVIGPGMGQSPESKKNVLALLQLDKPIVMDADGLNILALQKKWPQKIAAQLVLTPHPGEMSRLLKLFSENSLIPNNEQKRCKLVQEFSKKINQIVVLKGHRTIVTDGRQVFINNTGDSSLSKAGSGDILSGMIATLLAQKVEPFKAACLGVQLHGLAGEYAGKKYGQRSVLAHEVIAQIAEVLKKIDKNA
jgi:hydroxyethylthiazole kinase-like uncharacterized protein yjeF